MKKLTKWALLIAVYPLLSMKVLSLDKVCSGDYWHNCFGQYTWSNGDIYKGEWRNDDLHGVGSYYYGQGSEWAGDYYVGEWKYGLFDGQGTYTYFDGGIIKGEWKQGMVNGQAIQTFGASSEWVGDKYVGEYKDNYFNGQGTYTYYDGTIVSGIWRDGQFQYATNETSPNDYSNNDQLLPASSGSGFAVTADGHIITNHHVIDGCNHIDIIDKGKIIPANLISFDINNDLALLKSEFNPQHYFPLVRKNPYALMEIYVAGYPFGYDISTPIKITKGIVSSLAGLANNFSQIQIDAAIQPGNSGGPIVDKNGNVVGVAVSKLDLEHMIEAYGVVPEGTNFGIKSNVVINFLESNGIETVDANSKDLTKESLGKAITDGTYYISCLMTMAQINNMKERKVVFSNLK